MSYLFDVSGNARFGNTLDVCGNILNDKLQTSISSISPNLSGNVYVNNLNVYGVFNIFPPGTIMAFVTSNVPYGWLLCDGSYFLQTQYPNLFEAISTRYGSTSTSNFRVPNCQGAFLRGIGTSSFDSNYQGIDGSQNETILSHTHDIQETDHVHMTTERQNYSNPGWDQGSYLTGPGQYGRWSQAFSGGTSDGAILFGYTNNSDYALKTGSSYSNINNTTTGALGQFTRPFCWGVKWCIKY